MDQRMRAIYRQGMFVLKELCDIPDESEVELIVQGPLVLPPQESDPVERARLLKNLTKRMQQNRIPLEAPRFTRDELHERR